MNKLKEMDVLELQETQGGFDPASWAIGFLLGNVVNGITEAATGKSLGGWVATGLNAVVNCPVQTGPGTAGYSKSSWQAWK